MTFDDFKDFQLIPEVFVRTKVAKVSEATWYRMRKENLTPTPAKQLRGRRYYLKSEVEQWLKD